MPQTIPNRLNELPIESLTDSFLGDFDENKSRNIHLFNIVSGFEYLSKMTEQVQTFYDTYNKQAFALTREWNTVYMTFIDSYNASPFIKDYQPVVSKWQTELLTHKDSVTAHLRYLDEFFTIADSLNDHQMLSYINKMHVVAKQSQTLSKGYAVNFEESANMIEVSLQSMKKAAQYLS